MGNAVRAEHGTMRKNKEVGFKVLLSGNVEGVPLLKLNHYSLNQMGA
jgi:hypothetical protein